MHTVKPQRSRSPGGHARRYVFNARQRSPEVSREVLALYRRLYDIEERARRVDPISRLLMRRRESVPLMQRMEVVLNSPAAMKLLPKSKRGRALSYMRNRQVHLRPPPGSALMTLLVPGVALRGPPATVCDRCRGRCSRQVGVRSLAVSAGTSGTAFPYSNTDPVLHPPRFPGLRRKVGLVPHRLFATLSLCP
jgi:hypothetical protein